MKLFTISVIGISSLAIGSMTWAAASENDSAQRNQPTATVTDGVIAGCWSAKTGKLKIKSIDSTELQTCPRGNQRVAWNKQGAQGLTGPEGPEGEKGERGLTGFTGETGARGPRGETGPEGPQGLQGIKGDDGDPGVTGPQGERGPSGISAAYVGTNSVTVPAGKYVVTQSFQITTPTAGYSSTWYRCSTASSAAQSTATGTTEVYTATDYEQSSSNTAPALQASGTVVSTVTSQAQTTLSLNCSQIKGFTTPVTTLENQIVALAVDSINP